MNCIINILEENDISYIIKEGKYKKLSVFYNHYNLLEIHCPVYLKEEVMINFIESHIDWILENKPVKLPPHTEYHDGDIYLMLGREKKLIINYSNHEEVIERDDSIIVYAASTKHIETLLNEHRKKNAEVVFNEMLYRCFMVMSKELLKYPKLIIKESKTRWGTCNTKDNEIMLNISLIHTPLPLIEFVIYHELTHYIVHGHSKKFHAKLRKYLPDESKRRKMLKNYCIIYK